jgi:HK97 family phage portal protein
VTFYSSLKNVVTRAARLEGGRLTTPLAPVSQPEQGWIPMSWPLNFWQCGNNVLPDFPCSTVDACIWAYVRAVAQLPGYHKIEDDDGGVSNVTTSALSRILRYPNSYQTRSDFLTHAIRSLLYTGNWYSLAIRNARQEAAELHWLNSTMVRLVDVAVEGQFLHEIFYAIGGASPIIDWASLTEDGRTVVPARDIMHVKLATPRNPLIGETPVASLSADLVNRSAMSYGMQTFFNNSSRPSGVITTDLELGTAQVEDLRQRWAAQTVGTAAGGTPILTHGLKWQQTGISQRDSQVIEALKLSDKQIAGIFGVPGILIGVDDGKTFATTEALMNFWLSNGLGYLLDHIETAFDQFFGLAGVEAGEWTEYDTEALLRTELLTRIDALTRGVIGGIYAPNEARAKEGYAAVEAGDEPRVQQQVVPLSFATNPPPKPQPAAPAIPAAGDQQPTDQQPVDPAAAKIIDLVAYAKGLEAYELTRAAA